MFCIKKRREAAGLTVTQLADRVGVTSGAISQWESGLTLPTSAKLPTIAAALGCTIDELYHDGKEEN